MTEHDNGQTDKHEIDPITEIIVNLNGAIDYLIGLRHERRADKARIAEQHELVTDLQNTAAEVAADFERRRQNLLTTCKGNNDRIADLERQLAEQGAAT